MTKLLPFLKFLEKLISTSRDIKSATDVKKIHRVFEEFGYWTVGSQRYHNDCAEEILKKTGRYPGT